MLEKVTSVDLVEVAKNNFIHVYTKIVILEDGVELSSQTSRRTLAPGECSDSEDAKVKAVCAAVHTPELVAAYQAEQEEFAQGTKIPA
jgi:hypothetical protein